MFVKIGRFGAFILFCLFVFPSFAQAEINIAVVDIQKLQSQSAAAVSIQEQLESKRNALQSEFAGYEQELRENEKKLVETKDKMSADELNLKRKEFETKLLETRQLVQERRRDLEVAVAKASKKLNDEIFKIVAEQTEKENYQLVLTRQNVVLVEKSIDITETVMEILNKEIKSIKLEELQ